MKKGYIYKLTTPSGGIYIGQTSRLVARRYSYEKLFCKRQTCLYNALLKYGFNACSFEILDELHIEKELYVSRINELEIYWIEFYKSNRAKYPLNNGLNLKAGGAWERENTKPKQFSEEKFKILSERFKGRVFSDEHKAKISASKMGVKRPKWIGEQHSLKLLGRKNKPHSQESKDKIKKAVLVAMGKVKDKLENRRLSQSNWILNTETGIFYAGLKEASFSGNICRGTLINNLYRNLNNRTAFIIT